MNKPKLIVYDFDGVMTDNRVLVDEFGKEAVVVNRGDGYGVSQIKKLGILQVIISTEVNKVVKMRAEKLDIPVIHGVENKKNVLLEYVGKQGIDLKDVFYVGNDLNDYDAMILAGTKCAPKDAEPEILEIADWVSVCNGGYGVIRDLFRNLSK